MHKALYVVEHPDHVCTLCYFHSDKEKEAIGKLLKEGILWFENLGRADACKDWEEAEFLAKHCSRPLIPLNHALNEPGLYIPSDHAERLLATGGPAYNGMSQVEYGPRVFLRFGFDSTELVCTPYDHCDWRAHDSVTVPMYIQETMIRPICTLSVDPNDLAYAECDWREFLGSVQANVIGKETVDVQMADANRLVRECSRRMLLVSQCLPPTYIPRQWLESVLADFRQHSLQR